MKQLLARGALPNERGFAKTTPLMAAAGHGQTETVKALLKHGADPNSVDRGGTTALVIAAGYGFTEIVKVLLKNGARAIPAGQERSALREAERHRHADIVRLLRQAQKREKSADWGLD